MTTQSEKPVVFRKGKKTLLVPIDLKYVPDLLAWINDPENTQFLMASFPVTLLQEEGWIKDASKRSESNVKFGVMTHDGKLIGTMGIYGINWIHRTATTGALIGDPEYRSGGYGTDAKMQLLDYAFNTLGLRKICSSVLAFNGRSKRYNQKCGYQVEGVLKKQIFRNGVYHDEIRMAVFKEDWLPLWEEYSKEG